MVSPDLKLSLGIEYDPQLREGATEEFKAWGERGELPSHFRENCRFLEEQIREQSPLFKVFQGFTIA